MKFYNTLTRKKELFKPVKKGQVGMYTCGPTVYDFAHIGNFRSYVFDDLLRRWLKYRNFKVNQVMNITDIDDKTIKGSIKEGISLKEYTKKYEKAFFEDLDTLNIERAEVYPEATKHVKGMVELVQKLVDNGHTYESKGTIYFRISSFKDYGKLARIKVEDLKAGARVCQDEYEKENASDFALWKAWDENDGDVFWETNIGKGRPGWHIECSAMSMKYLGETFDIHTGGVDLIFPHHTNEICQAEGATGKKFVNYWLHNEHLIVEGKKMSKSLGNFYTLRDILEKGYKPMAIRYELLVTHYRQKLNFSFKSLKAAENSIGRLQDLIIKLKSANGKTTAVKKLIENTQNKFEDAMDDDLNISIALASLFDFVRDTNKLLLEGKISKKNAKDVLDFLKKIDSVLGIIDFEEQDVPKEVQELAEKREQARKNKNFAEADKLRDEITKKDYIIEDTNQGPRLKKK